MPRCSLLLLSCALAACTQQRMATIVPVDLGTPPTAEGPPVMAGLTPTALGSEIAAAGLDVEALPAIGALSEDQLMPVMKLFTKSLGATCNDCHVKDKAEETANKRVARKMWSELVQKLTLADGRPLFCDSCHQGKLAFLPRESEEVLTSYMKASFVAGLARRDGAKHGCGTCHGTPFQADFLDTWGEAEPAPDAGTMDLSGPGPDQGEGPDLGASPDLGANADLSVVPSSCALVVNEVQVGGAGGATDEFIELYNPCAAAASLAGYALAYRSAAGTSDVLLLRFGAQAIPAGGYLVAANAGFTGPKGASYTGGLAATGGGVALRDTANAIVDSIAYGTASNAFLVGTPAPAPPSGSSIARTPNGARAHGDHSKDLSVATPTPGAAN